MGHKKTFTNIVVNKGHENMEINISMFNCFGSIPECEGSISLSNLGGQLSDSLFEYICLFQEGYCCDLGGFDAYSSF